jgi:RNA polymerase-binding transcription factor DksA
MEDGENKDYNDSGGVKMEANIQKLYKELRENEQEITKKLDDETLEEWFGKILRDELFDIKLAIDKFDCGKFGKCEISGELLPQELIKMMPTVKSLQDLQGIDSFCRKPLNSSF